MSRGIFLVLMVVAITGCSGNNLASRQKQQFVVDSVPVGASVIVLGKAVGQTPMHLTPREVFPQSFEHDKQHLYGRVEIRYPGCESYITTVSSRVIRDGIKATLKCDGEGAAPTSIEEETTDSSSPAQTATLRQRLQSLKELFDDGLISQQDYDEKRRELLQEL